MSYPKLDIHAFGAHLLQSQDLDPVYVVLNSDVIGWNVETKARWCLAYWCLYNCGVACYIAEEPDEFWERLYEAALNTSPAPTGGRWPRGKERRHWRAAQAIQSWEHLHNRYARAPENFVGFVGSNPPPGVQIGVLGSFDSPALPFTTVADRVQEHRGFGPWMAFKVADMLEQVWNVPVNFDNAAVFMFKDPKEAALRFWRRVNKLPDNARPKNEESVIGMVVDHLQDAFRKEGFVSPNGKRRIGLQEVETILCKWKSHDKGHYPLNNDIHELVEGLKPWMAVSPLARRFMEAAGGLAGA
jgi:amino acid-DNA transferase-like protein